MDPGASPTVALVVASGTAGAAAHLEALDADPAVVLHRVDDAVAARRRAEELPRVHVLVHLGAPAGEVPVVPAGVQQLAVLPAGTAPEVRLAALRAGWHDVVALPLAPGELLHRVQVLRGRADAAAAVAKLEAQLAHSNHQLERFAYPASHDLKEPLRAVTGFARLLQDRYAGRLDDNADTYLAFILDGGERLGTMINALLEYSRLSRHPIEPLELDVNALTAEILAEHDEHIGEHDITVAVEPLPTLLSDERLLRTTLSHLISNALRFVDPDRPMHVQISAAATADGWRLDISDTGIGIADSDQGRIWDMFTRLHARDVYPGNGLGLALVAIAVPRLGGTVQLRSQRGQGTTVSLHLPPRLDGPERAESG